MSYIKNFSGVNPETMDRNFNAYIALTLDESLTIELRTKALLSYLYEISSLLASANAIIADLSNIVKYETDLIFQGWVNDGTITSIITDIVTPTITQINNLMNANLPLITSANSQNNVLTNQLTTITTRLTSQVNQLTNLLASYTALNSLATDSETKYQTLTDTLNTALNTITTIQDKLTASQANLNTLNNTVNDYQTQFEAFDLDTLWTAIETLLTNVTNAQNELETNLETHTSNVSQVVTLYSNLNQSLINLTSFADSARQFQLSILNVLNFINTNQPTVTSNQTTVANLITQLNTLLAFHLDFQNQFQTILQVQSTIGFNAVNIITNAGQTLWKLTNNRTVTYTGLITNVQLGLLFTDSDLAQTDLNTSSPNWSSFVCVGSTTSGTQLAPCLFSIAPNGNVLQVAIPGTFNWVYFNFSILIPSQLSGVTSS